MSKKRHIFMLVILIAGLLLTACERPASVAPAVAPTQTGESAFPLPTQSQLMKDILSSTQTAQAKVNAGQATAEPTQAQPPNPADTQAVVQPTAKVVKPLPSPTPGHPSNYTIQKGDHFYCIARRFNVNPFDLASVNGYGTPPQSIQPGLSLKIPSSGSWPSSLGARSLRTHPTTYKVAAGDNIYSIACLFGDVSPEAILAASGMTKSAVTTGAILNIP